MGGNLKGRKVDTVYVLGLAGNVCINFTLKDARELGFEGVLFEDGTRPIDQEAFEKALGELKERQDRVSP